MNKKIIIFDIVKHFCYQPLGKEQRKEERNPQFTAFILDFMTIQWFEVT